MDCFDSDSDDEENENLTLKKFNELFIYVMKLKPYLRQSMEFDRMYPLEASDNIISKEETILYHKILIIHPEILDLTERQVVDVFLQRLKQSKFNDLEIFIETDITDKLPFESNSFDIVLFLTSILSENVSILKIQQELLRVVIPYGEVVISKQVNIHSDYYFKVDKEEQYSYIKLIKKTHIQINKKASSYWADENYQASNEENSLEQVVVRLSFQERKLGIFADSTLQKSLEILEKYGLVIFPSLFPSDMVESWITSAKNDLISAFHQLKSKHNINLMTPGIGPKIENYFELSMREAFRVDIRHGKETNLLVEKMKQDVDKKKLTISSHNGIYNLLSETMFRKVGEHASGNWGLWNFEGLGPEYRPKIVIGEVGAVVTLPGCVDQTIHADTPHIFTPVHLPGHYFNLFLGGDTSHNFDLGQTAFVLESHKLEVSSKVMADEDGSNNLKKGLLRPHLLQGDALLFDTRILHWGLANSSSAPIDYDAVTADSLRVVLYQNHHQSWFTDRKNWNDRQRLF